MTIYIFDNLASTGVTSRQFSNTFSTAVTQSPTYDPSIVPLPGPPPRPPRIPPEAPPADPNYKEVPLFLGGFDTPPPPYSSGFNYFIPIKKPVWISSGSPGYEYDTATRFLQHPENFDVEGEPLMCQVWDQGVRLFPSHNYQDTAEYPPHAFWHPFYELETVTTSLQEEVADIMFYYEGIEFFTIRAHIAIGVGDALWGCQNPDDGFIFHTHGNPDYVKGTVPSVTNGGDWDDFSYKDAFHFSISSGGEPIEVEIARENPAFETSYPEEEWYVEPFDTDQGGWAGSGGGRLLRPVAHSWLNQNTSNTANRSVWLPEELLSVSFWAEGAWGALRHHGGGIAYELNGYKLSQTSQRWMCVL